MKPNPLDYGNSLQKERVIISKEDSESLVEEMGIDKEYICPYCFGIILYRSKLTTSKRIYDNRNRVGLRCGECNKYFTAYPLKNRIKGEIASFIIYNIDLLSSQDLSRLIYKYFGITITPIMVSIFKKKTKKSKIKYPKYSEAKYGDLTKLKNEKIKRLKFALDKLKEKESKNG